jgi:2-phospho-L-lactate guanylyltransferase
VRAHVLVPVKPLREAKSRLAAQLDESERAALVHEMLALVLAAVGEAAVGPVTVVSSHPLELNGVPRFDDHGLPWNEALAAAMRRVVTEPCAAVVAADLPLLQPAEVRALVAAAPERGVAIARAKDGGTNALAMRPPAVLATLFGRPQSCREHEQAARQAGLEAVVLDLPGLAFDVDTPEDLAAWR